MVWAYSREWALLRTNYEYEVFVKVTVLFATSLDVYDMIRHQYLTICLVLYTAAPSVQLSLLGLALVKLAGYF